jgi:sugar/nucleoside kinase (ribokinase family)
MALSLGARVDLITRLTDDYDTGVLDGINVLPIAADETCRYANSYDANGDRTQLLLVKGEPLPNDVLEYSLGRPDAVVFAPAYHEFEAPLPVVTAAVVAASLQGALRSRTRGDRVVPHPQPLEQCAPFAAAGRFLLLSEEDTADADGLARALSEAGATVFVTRGYRGATRFSEHAEHRYEAIPARPVDPTGAGDCFSMAFVVRMVETGDVDQACRFALAAGSLAVEATGIATIPTRAAVEARLQGVAA